MGSVDRREAPLDASGTPLRWLHGFRLSSCVFAASVDCPDGVFRWTPSELHEIAVRVRDEAQRSGATLATVALQLIRASEVLTGLSASARRHFVLQALAALAEVNDASFNANGEDLAFFGDPAQHGQDDAALLERLGSVLTGSGEAGYASPLGRVTPAAMVLCCMRSPSPAERLAECQQAAFTAASWLSDRAWRVYCPALRDRNDPRTDEEILTDHEERLDSASFVVAICSPPSRGVDWALGRLPGGTPRLVLGRQAEDKPWFVRPEDFVIFDTMEELEAALTVAVERLPVTAQSRSAPTVVLRTWDRLRSLRDAGRLDNAAGMSPQQVESLLTSAATLAAASYRDVIGLMEAADQADLPVETDAPETTATEFDNGVVTGQGLLPLGDFTGADTLSPEVPSIARLRMQLQGTRYLSMNLLTPDERAAAESIADQVDRSELNDLLEWANLTRGWMALVSDSASATPARFRKPLELNDRADWETALRQMRGFAP